MADTTPTPAHTRTAFRPNLGQFNFGRLNPGQLNLARFNPATPHLIRLHLALAIFLTLGGSVCLWLASFSTPFIKGIFYLELNRAGENTKFGSFGFCRGVDEVRCIPPTIGWSAWFEEQSGDRMIPYRFISNSEGLTGSLILTPIVACIAALLVLWHVISLFRRRGALVGFLLTAFTALTAVSTLMLAVVTFVTGNHRGIHMFFGPRYGAALWLHIAGVILLVLALPFTLFAWLGQKKAAGQTVEMEQRPLIS